MHKPFRENRLAIQEALINKKFLKPLTKNDLPVEIIEYKNKKRIDKFNILLQNVIIRDTPVEDKIRPKSWILDLEIKEPPILANPPSVKTTESALIVLGSDSLLILLIELKTSLHPFDEDTSGKLGIGTLREKIEDTISRISMLIPLYVFDESYSNIFEIKYKALIFYNRDDGLHNPTKASLDRLTENKLYQIWKEQQKIVKKPEKIIRERKILNIVTPLDTKHEVECFFFKNPSNTDSFEVSFKQFFHNDWEYESAKWGDQTCPVLLKKN